MPSFRATKRMMRVSVRRHGLHFGDRYGRRKAQEQKEEREKQAERSKVSHQIHPGWLVVTPARRQEIAMERGDDNHKAFEPHADIHEDRQDEHGHEVLPEPLEPEKLRSENVAPHHDEVRP